MSKEKNKINQVYNTFPRIIKYLQDKSDIDQFFLEVSIAASSLKSDESKVTRLARSLPPTAGASGM